MKKLLVFAMALLLVLPMATVVSAATTTLTFTVPEAEYTLVIPKSVEIPYKATRAEIGRISVKDTAGFAELKDLVVYVTLTPFTSPTTDSVLPYTLSGQQAAAGSKEYFFEDSFWIVFEGQEDGTLSKVTKFMVNNEITGADMWYVNFEENAWDALKPGDYTGYITFDAQVTEHAWAG